LARFRRVRWIAEASGLPKELKPGEEFVMTFEVGSVWLVPVLDFLREGVAETRDTVEVRGYVRIGRETLYAPRSYSLNRPTA
jgi:hypothetical protein